MRDLEDQGIVLRNTISFEEVRDRQRGLVEVHVSGWNECEDVLVKVDKWLEVRRRKDGRYEVRGRDYVYHAVLRKTNEQLLRYDNAHGPTAFHRHRFHPHSGREHVEPITRDDLPTLDHVILEAVEAGRAAKRARRSPPQR